MINNYGLSDEKLSPLENQKFELRYRKFWFNYRS